jgi:hypothetical protein
MDKDGNPKGPAGRTIYTEKTMTADECAFRILKAARASERQVIMLPGKIGLWSSMIAPKFTDKMIVERILRPAVSRTLKKD